MRTWLRKPALAALALAMAAAGTASASYEEKDKELKEASRDALDALVKLRDDGALDDASALRVIQELVSPHFDFEILTQQVIGKHWRKASSQQRAQLTDLFRKLVEKTYSKSVAKFSNQTVEFVEAAQLKDKSVNSGIKILNKGTTVLLEYQLKENKGEWYIADVKVEKISLLSNFRRQFSAVIRKSGIDGLIGLLSEKV